MCDPTVFCSSASDKKLSHEFNKMFHYMREMLIDTKNKCKAWENGSAFKKYKS